MIFFFFVFLFHSLVNAYIFHKGWKALPVSRPIRIIYSLLFFVFYSSFIIAMIGRNVLPLEVQKILYFPGTSWFGFMLYLTFFFLITDLIYLLNRFWHFIPKTISRQLFYRIQVISGYLIVAIILSIGHYNFKHPVIVEKEIIIPKNGNKYTELKVAAVSDIHLGVAIDKAKLKRYVQLINEQNPDIIIIAGDMIDNNPYPLHKEKMYEEINQLNAPLGVYFCLGNHEYISGMEDGMDFLRKTNMTLVVDSAALVDDSFWIIGRDDKQGNPNRKALAELVAETNTNQPLILLDHEPYFLEEAVENGIDIQFSGHTHGGQLWPVTLIVKSIFEIGHGYKKKENTHVYVSSGLALWGPQVRIGTQSEIVILNIRFEE